METIIKSPKSAIEWQQYFNLRYRILREPWGQPIGSERNDGDSVAIHASCYVENKLVAVARLDVYNKDFGQVRFMAVEKGQQGKGLGKIVMHHLEEKSIARGDLGMILYAREKAIGFYEHLGYKTMEQSYLLFGEIQHYLMQKEYAGAK